MRQAGGAQVSQVTPRGQRDAGTYSLALSAPLPAARGAGQCQCRSQNPEWGQERLTWPAWLMLRPGVPTAHTEGLSLAVPEGSLTHC